MLYRLKNSGYESYLVGGCVRDLLLGLNPKDFDIATNATPEQVRGLFNNSRLIGRRFKLVHVTFGREIIEVATFRAGHEETADDKNKSSTNDQGMLLRDNVYGTLEDDAVRRDFTVNALYYGVQDFSIKAYGPGLKDLKSRTLRIIGEPEVRYREDPVRMLRAARFAAKLDFQIEAKTKAPIKDLYPLLFNIPPARMFDEVLKLFLSGRAVATFDQLRTLGLFEPLFPATAQLLNEQIEADVDREFIDRFLHQALLNTDDRIERGRPVTPAFLFAAFLWPVVDHKAKQLVESGTPVIPAFHQAAQQTISEQCRHTAIPKRFSSQMREIWDLQHRLPRRTPKRALDLLEHPRFRAAYDFLLLRESAGENMDGLGQWWTDFQEAKPGDRESMVKELGPGGKKRSQRKPRKRYRNYNKKPQRATE